MAQLLDLNKLDVLLAKAERLQEIISKNPEVVNFLQILKDTGTESIILPQKADKLITMKQAAEVLGVSPNRICEYVKSEVLIPYYTPPASSRKFWLSDVKAIARKAGS